MWPLSLFCGKPAPIHIANVTVGDVPHQEIKVGYPSKNFNCSILEHNGKLLLASRLGWAGSRLFISELDENFQPTVTHQLQIAQVHIPDGVEDPRLFIFEGKLHCAFIGFYKGPIAFTTQMVCVIDDDYKVVKTWVPQYNSRATWEKNWQFFDYDAELFCIYTVRPHTILLVQDSMAVKFAETQCPFHWRGHHFRGGAPPVRVGEEYYHFFHTMHRVEQRHEYTMGVYTFAARPPFEILRFSTEPILSACNDEPFNQKKVVFPCGVIRRDGRQGVIRRPEWIVSYGWQDQECRIAVFDEAVIEDVLVGGPGITFQGMDTE